MECSSGNVNDTNTMVATLQSRRKALEAKITEKNRELKHLCVQEAELTGSLPPEIPLEPGETPPTFRRRIGTSFTYPENLINKLKFKDDNTLASLELEYKIQKGIAEAALGFANDEIANKSVRRKHRMMYQQSQQRLAELETRISIYNNQKIKQTLPPHVNTDFENNQNFTAAAMSKLQNVTPSLNSKGLANKCNLRPSQSYNKFSGQNIPVHDLRIGNKTHTWRTHEYTPISNIQPVILPKSSSLDKDHVSYSKDTGPGSNINSNSVYLPSSHELPNKYKDRFLSLNRRNRSSSVIEEEICLPVFSHYTNSQSGTTSVLLPNQMYPENSLMRTHSLGNIKNESQLEQDMVQPPLVSDNKNHSEKKWIETSLDFRQTVIHEIPSRMKMCTPPPPLASKPEIKHSNVYDVVDNFDTVPFESSKNHTVVQVGKWQPYREITKPFEMSDFYKYSTRYRKPAGHSSFEPPENVQNTSQSPQNKGVYQPLKPNNCNPISPPNISSMEETVCPVDSLEPNNKLCLDESVFANEMLSWYEEDTTSRSKTATLV